MGHYGALLHQTALAATRKSARPLSTPTKLASLTTPSSASHPSSKRLSLFYAAVIAMLNGVRGNIHGARFALGETELPLGVRNILRGYGLCAGLSQSTYCCL